MKKTALKNTADGTFNVSSVHSQFVTPVLFTLAILISAGLLFFIQPLLTRMITPLIGGAPGVWTTATLFFQTMMIAGYLYAHLITRLPRIRHQIGLHLMLWLIASSFLPLQLPDGWRPTADTSMQAQTLYIYAATIGVPFFFLSANAPLIQTWYSRTKGPSADDPYFLYGASNVGSLVALLGFPLIAEPFLGVGAISMGWSTIFIALGALLFISVFWTTRDHPDAKTVLPIIDKKSDMNTLFTWGAIAFVPSSMMLALTTKITSDFGSFPLLWVLPLAVYLLTYVGGFQTRPLLADKIMVWLYPVVLGVLAIIGMSGAFGQISLISAGIMILCFAVMGLHLHRVLYLLRPDPSRLTIFYLTLSIGGALGGFFNAIVAPTLMDGMYEFPLTLLAAAAVLMLIGDRTKNLGSNAQLGLILSLTLLGAISFSPDVFKIIGSSSLTVYLIIVGCLMLIFPISMRAGIAVMTAVTASVIVGSSSGDAIHTERNFFGIHTVVDNGKLRGYLNGTTIHGAVDYSNPGAPHALYYYLRGGPLADLSETKAWQESDRIGLVGLGIGSMLAYRNPEQSVSLYEIDPAVVDIAIDPHLFGFVDHYGDGSELFVGDARVMLEEQEKNEFGVLLIDTYSSDAIPMHLTTVEAMEIFLEDVADGGVLAFHITNRNYDLRAPIGAAAAHLGMKVYHRMDAPADVDRIGFNSRISALVVVRPDDDHPFLYEDGSKWQEIRVDPSLAWSDDKSSPITALSIQGSSN